MNKFAAPLLTLALLTAIAPAAWAQLDSSTEIEATSAILDAGLAAAQIKTLRNVPSVGVFVIDSLMPSMMGQSGPHPSDLTLIADHNSVWVNRLRHALSSNPVTRRVMAQHGVDVNRVDGVSIGASGSLRFFVEG